MIRNYQRYESVAELRNGIDPIPASFSGRWQMKASGAGISPWKMLMPIRRIGASDVFSYPITQQEGGMTGGYLGWHALCGLGAGSRAHWWTQLRQKPADPIPGRCFMTNPPIPCYDRTRIRRGDPGVRFLGETIEKPVLGLLCGMPGVTWLRHLGRCG